MAAIGHARIYHKTSPSTRILVDHLAIAIMVITARTATRITIAHNIRAATKPGTGQIIGEVEAGDSRNLDSPFSQHEKGRPSLAALFVLRATKFCGSLVGAEHLAPGIADGPNAKCEVLILQSRSRLSSIATLLPFCTSTTRWIRLYPDMVMSIT